LHELERRGVTQDELAAVLGLSRPQLTNGLRRRFGLGDRPAVALKAWLLKAVA
jgi:transcriptional regulator with XRE-family HTH domain